MGGHLGFTFHWPVSIPDMEIEFTVPDMKIEFTAKNIRNYTSKQINKLKQTIDVIKFLPN